MSSGRIEGHGDFTDAEGNRYVGHFTAGVYNGVGTYYLANGRAEVSRYLEGREVGVGAAWSVDRKQAWRLAGVPGLSIPQPISLAEAEGIALGLGVPIPPTPGEVSACGPLL